MIGFLHTSLFVNLLQIVLTSGNPMMSIEGIRYNFTAN
jgi:hypothetical protein